MRSRSLTTFTPDTIRVRNRKLQGQTRVTILLVSGIHAVSWVVICAAKYLNLQFPTILITQRSVVQIHPPQPKTPFLPSDYKRPTPNQLVLRILLLGVCRRFRLVVQVWQP